MNIESRSKYIGCLLGGALGDALGWPVEFMSLDEIRQCFGPQGITEPLANDDGVFEITDDTQMTLFTAEGLIRAMVRGTGRGICSIETLVQRAYLRWLRTQEEPWPGQNAFETSRDGWLIQERQLWVQRAPGVTCLMTLRMAGDDIHAQNDSKGCGAVMKTAPVGLFPSHAGPFSLGNRVALITHGHMTAGRAAGALSLIINDLSLGRSLRDATQHALDALASLGPHEEVLDAMHAAVRMAERREVKPEDIESLGGGWVAEEALAIALACALRAESFEEGVRLAVNHSGDSDSTGAIAGNILGATFGVESLPKEWLDRLELRDVIAQMAEDLFKVACGGVPCVSHIGMPMLSETPEKAERRRQKDSEASKAWDLWAARYPPY